MRGIHQHLPEREGGQRRRLPARRHRLLCKPRRPGRAGDDRADIESAVASGSRTSGAPLATPSDNGGGSGYRSHAFRDACKAVGLCQVRARTATPKTNGRAKRFIKTDLDEWAYARAYPNSDQRGVELLLWLHRYNWHRSHGSLKYMTPISRLRLTEDNLLRLHS